MAVGGALFGGGRQNASAKSSLVEFRAGKMTLGANNLVTPDKRKGLVMVEQSDDQLMHFKWKDRTSGTVEDDLIIFPDDIEFKKVSQCTTGRVFILKFKSSNRKMFFWMQEPKTDKDDDYCKKVNDFLNNPPAPGSSRSAGGSSGGAGSALGGIDLSNVGDSELQSLLSSMSQQQLMQLFGGGLGSGAGGGLGGLASLLGAAQTPTSGRQRTRTIRGSPTTPTTTTAASGRTATTTTTTATPTTTATTAATPATAGASGGNPAIQLSDLQNILSGIKMPDKGDQVPVDLSSGITAEVVGNLLKKPDFLQKMKNLLPAEHQTGENVSVSEEIKTTSQSPPFQQSMQMFSSAFQSCQLAPLIREFGLCEKAVEAAAKGDMEAFVKALEEDSKAKKDEGPEDMALD